MQVPYVSFYPIVSCFDVCHVPGADRLSFFDWREPCLQRKRRLIFLSLLCSQFNMHSGQSRKRDRAQDWTSCLFSRPSCLLSPQGFSFSARSKRFTPHTAAQLQKIARSHLRTSFRWAKEPSSEELVRNILWRCLLPADLQTLRQSEAKVRFEHSLICPLYWVYPSSFSVFVGGTMVLARCRYTIGVW